MQTLFEKVWQEHVIKGEKGQAQLIYVDLQMIHEVTSPQAFEGLRQANRPASGVFSACSHFGPPIAPINIASALWQACNVFVGKGSPVLSMAAPPKTWASKVYSLVIVGRAA